MLDRTELERFTREQFDFLKEHGFLERINRRRKGATTNIIFRSDVHQLGLCISLDFEQYSVSITIAQLERGEWPNHFYKPFHQSLDFLLRETLAIDDPTHATISQLQQKSENEPIAIEIIVMLYSEVVRKHIAALVQRPLWELFPIPPNEDAKWMGVAHFQVELLALKLFGPLLKVKGFLTQPLFEHESLVSDITWRKGDIGIQLGFDWRDGYVHLYFQRLINGDVPERYWDYKWEYEKLVRDHLGDDPALALLRHIDEDTPFAERGYCFADDMLTAYHDLVSHTLDDILEQVVPDLSEKSR